MKKQILAIALVGVFGVTAALAQGTMKFSNFEGTASAPTLKALVYGVEPALVQGNPSTGVPAGNAVYSSTPLSGTGFTVGLWIGTATDPVSTSTFRTGTGAGVIIPKTVTVNGALPGTTVQFFLRAWDNKGGTVTTWAQVLADPTIARGWSTTLTSGQLGGTDAGGNIFLAPAMTGLTSFSLFAVPEPSIVGLGILGGLGLFLIRRRH